MLDGLRHFWSGYRVWLIVPALALLPVLNLWPLVPIGVFFLAHRFRYFGLLLSLASVVLGIALLFFDGTGFSGFGYVNATIVLIALHVGVLAARADQSGERHGLWSSTLAIVILLFAGSIYTSIDIGLTVDWDGYFFVSYVALVWGALSVGLRRPVVIAAIIAGLVLLLGWLGEIYLYESEDSAISAGWISRFGVFHFFSEMSGYFIFQFTAGMILTIVIQYWVGKVLRQILLGPSIGEEPGNPAPVIATVFVLACASAITYEWVSNPLEYNDFDLHVPMQYWAVFVLVGIVVRRRVVASASFAAVIMLIPYAFISSRSSYLPIGTDPFALLGPVVFAVGLSAIGNALGRRLLKGDERQAVLDQTTWFIPLVSQGRRVSDPEQWARQHDEISITIRRVMLSLLAFGVFCGLALADDDVALMGVGSQLTLPFVGVAVDYRSFLVVGPLILVGITAYLHLFLQASTELGPPPNTRALPYIFNMKGRVARALSTFLFYWLPVLLLCLFTWKALPLPFIYRFLGLLTGLVATALAYVFIGRRSSEELELKHRGAVAVFTVFLAAFLFVLTPVGGVGRSIDLEGANLRNLPLQGVNLSGARLSDADLSGADLTNVDISRADLTDAEIDAVNLTGANLTASTGFECEDAYSAVNFDTTNRLRTRTCRLPMMVVVMDPETEQSFAIGRFPVSLQAYSAFENGLDAPESEEFAEYLMRGKYASIRTYTDAENYINWLNKVSDQYQYRMATRAEWLLANEESRIGFGTNSAESIVELLADCIGDTCYVAEAYPAFESEVGSYFSDTYTLDSQILPEDVTFRLVRELEYEEDEEDDPTGPWGW